MDVRTKKLDFYLRFDVGGWNGLGHATRSIELAKELKKKFNVILCTNKKTKQFLKNKNYKYFLKKEKENEEKYILRISKKLKNKILFIDNIYNYKSKIFKKVTKSFKKIFFYQNFSAGIQKDNIIINPTPNLNYSKKISKKFIENKIYSGNKYLIVPKSKDFNKGNYLGISFGGSDPKNISIIVLKYLKEIKWEFPTYLFMGSFSNIQNRIKKIKKSKNIKICKFNKQKFLNSYLAICSPGITAFELLLKSTFAIHISHTKRHSNLGRHIEKKYNFSKNLGIYNEIKLDKFKKYIYFYWKNEILIKKKIQIKLNFFKNSCKEIMEVIINETR